MTVDQSIFTSHAQKLVSEHNSSEVMRAKLRHLDKVLAEDKKMQEMIVTKFESFRSYFLLVWMLSNGLYVSLLTRFEDTKKVVNGYLTFVFISIMIVVFMRACGSILYHLNERFESLFGDPQISRHPRQSASEKQ